MRWFASVGIYAALTFPAVIPAQLTAQTAEPANAIRKQNLPDENTPRELFYPRYSLRDGYMSKLHMMDRAPRPIDFTISVHSLSGETVTSKKMQIQPAGDLVIDIGELLTDMNVDYRGDFIEGTLSVHFKGKGNPLGGRLGIVGPHETQNIGPVWSTGEGGQTMIPPVLNTFWYDLGGARDAQITVSNTVGEHVVADVYLDFVGKRHVPPPLPFTPYQTRQLSVVEMLAALKLTAYQAPLGGLSIVPRGQPTLIASGYITDPETHAQTPLNFPLPQIQPANALHTTGIPIGQPRADSPFAGHKGSNFTPHLYLRNLLSTEQIITLTVEVPLENGPQFVPLAPIRLPAFTTMDLRYDNYYQDLPLPLPFVSLRVVFNGPPGSVIGTMTIIDETTGEATPVNLSNEGNGYARSLASHWSFDDDSDVVVFFTNLGDTDCCVALRIDAGGVEYAVSDIRLTAHETRWYSLRDLRDKQIPDFRGQLLPRDATEGRLFYAGLDNVPMTGGLAEVPRIPR